METRRSEGALRFGPQRRDLVPVLVAAAPFVALLPAMLSGLVASQDGWVQYFPIRTLAADTLASGRFPAWTGVEFSGTGLFELGQAGVLSPTGLLGVVLPAVLAYNLTLAVGLSANALGAYFLGRSVSGSRLGALVAAVGFGASSFMWSEINHPDVLVSAAALPWALLGLELAGRDGRRRHGIAVVAAAFALCILAGHQQMAVACVLLVAGWAVLRPLVGGGGGWRGVLDGLAGLALGGAVAAVQVLPSLVAAADSGRSGYSFDEATGLALEQRQLPLVLFPHGSGSPASGDLPVQVGAAWPQVGVVLLVLAVGALALWRREWRVRAAAVLAGLVAVAALSPAFGPLARVVYEVPAFGYFRVWPRYLVVSRLAVALLAALAVAELRAGSAEQRRRVARWSLVAGGAYVALAAALAVLPVLVERRPVGLVVPAVVAVAAAGLAFLMARPAADRRVVVAGGVALVLLVAAESVHFMAPPPWRVPTVAPGTVEEAFDPGTARRFVADAPGPVERYLFLGSYPDEEVVRVIPRAPLSGLSGAWSANGYTPLARQDYLDALGMDFYGNVEDPSCLLRGPSRDLVLDLLSVSTVLTDDPAVARSLRDLGEVRAVPGARGFRRVDREPDLPAAWLVPVGRSAALEAGGSGELACRRLGAPSPAVAARSLRVRDDGVTVRLPAGEASVLVVSLADGAGWTATVDGRGVPTRTAYGALVAVDVPAGARTVELRYRTPLLLPGALASVAGLVVLSVVARPRRVRSGTVRGDG